MIKIVLLVLGGVIALVLIGEQILRRTKGGGGGGGSDGPKELGSALSQLTAERHSDARSKDPE